MLKCSKCGKAQPDKNFYKHKKSKTGRQLWCKACCRDNDLKRWPARRTRKQKLFRTWALKTYYGLTKAAYAQLLERQQYKCPVCDKRFSKKNKANVDHDHKSGKVRGLLHFRCNIALGFLKDNPETAGRAAKYLTDNL